MKYWIYNNQGACIGRTSHAEDAAALVSLYGDGAKVRYSKEGYLLWEEGIEFDGEAGESFDHAAKIMNGRIK
jgi:hypothetical protein